MGGGPSKKHYCYQYEGLIRSAQNDVAVFNCDACKMDGLGDRYVCTLCNNMTHPFCRHPKIGEDITHEYCRQSKFRFAAIPSTVNISTGCDNENTIQLYKRCTACRKYICGVSYHCEAESLDLHPGCYKLDRNVVLGNQVYVLQKQLSSVCTECTLGTQADDSFSDGWAYVSSSNYDRQFHVHCLLDKVHQFHTLQNNKAQGSPFAELLPTLMDLGHMKQGVADNNCRANLLIMRDKYSVAEPEVMKLDERFESDVKMGWKEDGLFMEYTLGGDEKTEHAADHPKGIRERIGDFFKFMYQKTVAGVKMTCEWVAKAAKYFYFVISTNWIQKIIDFFNGKLRAFTDAVWCIFKEHRNITVELLVQILKTFNCRSFSPPQCHAIIAFLEKLWEIYRTGDPIPDMC